MVWKHRAYLYHIVLLRNNTFKNNYHTVIVIFFLNKKTLTRVRVGWPEIMYKAARKTVILNAKASSWAVFLVDCSLFL